MGGGGWMVEGWMVVRCTVRVLTLVVVCEQNESLQKRIETIL